jgi:23S rRNA (cytidine1920-2'-O)/16S rRNA (cytidine1409-2'-O)-methyltransferase
VPGPRRARLDRELVRRGLASSREHAAALVEAGQVKVKGSVALKVATAVTADDPVVVAVIREQRWASRGAHKLLAALQEWPRIEVAGRRCLDAGASTGGFTDVLLRHGAASVAAVDVGYGQLAWALRSDPRVQVHDRTNIRDLTPDRIGGQVDLTVADLSFIGLALVLPALVSCTLPTGDLVVLVKPQFEVGREDLGRGGVVRDPALRIRSVLAAITSARVAGAVPTGVLASPLPGPAGNVEYLLHLRRGGGGPGGGGPGSGASSTRSTADAADWFERVSAAVQAGPQ